MGGGGLQVLAGGQDVHPDAGQILDERLRLPGGRVPALRPGPDLGRPPGRIAPMAPPADGLAGAYLTVRERTTALAAPLETEDFVVQSMPDASPAKWHLAHTSWFFETFVLGGEGTGYSPAHPEYGELFHSCFIGVGRRHLQPERGLLSRPTVAEVFAYRRRVDEAMLRTLAGEAPPRVADIVTLGLHHEQQHQELLLTDLKHLFSKNPLHPAYRPAAEEPGERETTPPLRFLSFPGGAPPFGHQGSGFAFDNETPRHSRLIPPFQLASRLVTNGEYLEFVEEGGYRSSSLWLSDGWDAAQAGGWEAPLYWRRDGEGFVEFSFGGLGPLVPEAPVSHVSYYEADAFARWRESRLPTEFEWESAAADLPVRGAFVENGRFRPSPARNAGPGSRQPAQLFGDAWEWTASAYLPYPRYRSTAGAIGEYNGKFMNGRMVLRGGSCLTPESHIRASYRNFLRPDARWQVTGIRLARDG